MTPIIAIVGPTGCGKSDLAIRIAEEFSGEVVNCDSLQVYRHFNVGTAKVPLAERRGIPHHLIDTVDPDELFTAGDYCHAARAVLESIAFPVVAGGTGFYLRALIEGLSEGPPRDEDLRAALAQRHARRPGSLHRLLNRFDPDAAGRIHCNDVNKTMRALETVLIVRRPQSDLFKAGKDMLVGYKIVTIGLNPPRPDLYGKLNVRSRTMFENGLIEEARRILSLGYLPTAKPFEAIGYKQTILHLAGRLTLDEAIAGTQMETRRYAKRQWTWFRKDRATLWFDGFGNCGELQNKIIREVSERIR